MCLVIRIKDGSLRVPPHAGRSHLVNREARRIIIGERLDVARSSSGQHLGRSYGHIFSHRKFVFTPSTVNLQHWNAPRIYLFLIELHPVSMIREAFPVALKAESPLPRLPH